MREFTGVLATVLSEETGDQWRPDPHCDSAWTTRLFGPGDLSLLLHFGNYEDAGDRVGISGVYPRTKRGETPPHKNVRITAARMRDPRLIARDITRRFLPRYLEQIEACRQRIARDNRTDEQRAELAEELAKLSGGSVRYEAPWYYVTFPVGGGTGEFQVYAHDAATVRIYSAEPQLLRALANAIGSAASEP